MPPLLSKYIISSLLLSCVFDPLPQAVIGQDIGARQAQILSLVGEIWHIILSSSHPLRIKFAVQSTLRSVPHWLALDCGKVKHKLFTGNLSSQEHTAPKPSGEH